MILITFLVINACLSTVASVCAIWLIYYRVRPTVERYDKSREKMDATMRNIDETVEARAEDLNELIEYGQQSLDNTNKMIQGVLTIQKGEGEFVIVPLSDHLTMAVEKLMVSMGGGYMSADPSKEELAMHEIKLKGANELGYRLGMGLRKGAQLEKYDPLVKRFSGGEDGGGEVPGGFDIKKLISGFIPGLDNFMGGGGGGKAQAAPAPKGYKKDWNSK